MKVRAPTVYPWEAADHFEKTVHGCRAVCNASIGVSGFRRVRPERWGQDLAWAIRDRWRDGGVLRLQNLWDSFELHPLRLVRNRAHLIGGVDLAAYTEQLVVCFALLKTWGIVFDTVMIDEEGGLDWDRWQELEGRMDASGRWVLLNLTARLKLRMHRTVRDAMLAATGVLPRVIDYTACAVSPFGRAKASDGLFARSVGVETSAIVTYAHRFTLESSIVNIFATAQATDDAVLLVHESNDMHLKRCGLTLNQHREQMRHKVRAAFAFGFDLYWFNPWKADEEWTAEMVNEEIDRLRRVGHQVPVVDQRYPMRVVLAVTGLAEDEYKAIEPRERAPEGAG